jgi:hypothetical protein
VGLDAMTRIEREREEHESTDLAEDKKMKKRGR